MRILRRYLPFLLVFQAFTTDQLLAQFGESQVIARDFGYPFKHISAFDNDADGDLDLFVFAGPIAWFNNDGQGRLSPMTPLTPDHGLNSGAAFDMDGDGDIDLLGVRNGEQWRYLNQGDGTFTGTLISSVSLAEIGQNNVGDVDADGDLDVVGRGLNLRNDGAGDFSAQANINTNAFSKLVDMDGDGDPDVLTPSLSSVVWRSNNGSGLFGTTQTFSDIGAWDAVGVDLNDDGLKDIVLAPELIDTTVAPWDIAVRLNLGGGTYGPLTYSGWVFDAAGHMVVADLDDDGREDVLLWNNFNLLRFHNDGSGVIADVDTLLWSRQQISTVVPADVNGDGALDLIVGAYENLYQYYIGELSNDGGGHFPLQPQWRAISAGWMWPMAADMNDDGYPDLISANEIPNDGGAVVMHPNDNGLGFNSPFEMIPRTQCAAGVTARPLALGDLDGDGDEDVVTHDFESDSTVWRPNLGDGHLGPPVWIPLDADHTNHLLAEDLNNDGYDDLVYDYLFGAFGSCLNDGTGHFPVCDHRDSTAELHILAIEDIDGDTYKEVLFGTVLALKFWPNNGDGTMAEELDGLINNITQLPWSPFSAGLIADLDGDGDQDVAYQMGLVASPLEVSTGWLANEGNGFFADMGVIADTIGQCSQFEAIDVDADGDLDISLVDAHSLIASVIPNAGSGNFLPRVVIEDSCSYMVWTDIDQDGWKDVILSDHVSYGDEDPILFWRRGLGMSLGNGPVAQSTAPQSSVMTIHAEAAERLLRSLGATDLVRFYDHVGRCIHTTPGIGISELSGGLYLMVVQRKAMPSQVIRVMID